MSYPRDDDPLVESIVNVCLAMLEDDGLVEDVIRHAIDCAWTEGYDEGYDEGVADALKPASEQVA